MPYEAPVVTPVAIIYQPQLAAAPATLGAPFFCYANCRPETERTIPREAASPQESWQVSAHRRGGFLQPDSNGFIGQSMLGCFGDQCSQEGGKSSRVICTVSASIAWPIRARSVSTMRA